MADDARAKLGELFQSLWTLGALSVAAERGVLDGIARGRALDDMADTAGLAPAVVRAALDVLASAGLLVVDGDRHVMTPSFATMLQGGTEHLRADLRSTLGQIGELVHAAREPGVSLSGWRAIDPVIVEAQAIVSSSVTGSLADFLLSQSDLRDRLTRPGAAILDVGAGGAGACVALARRFQHARIVGLEPAPEALAVARRFVADAGLSDRIELRPDAMGDLADESAFDFVYVAQMFMPRAILQAGLPAVLRALRPGGWLVTAATCVPGMTPAAAVARFRSATWGSAPDRFAADVIALLRGAGFVDVAVPFEPPGATLVPVLARAPAA